MNIILFGPPGAGKGTQSESLAKEFDLFKVSTGDLLRIEIKRKTLLGDKIKSLIDKGLLVSDEIINSLIEKILSNKNYFNRLIFDGYPRSLNQVKMLDFLIKKNNQKISCVLSLKVDLDSIIKRILGRTVCSNCGLNFNAFFNPASKSNHKCDPKFLLKRTDDNETIVRNRFQTYTKDTMPILNYYKKQNLLHEINGTRDISTIYQEIRQIIRSLDA